jgi:hypothetical protein
MDLHIAIPSINSSALNYFHVAHRELEQNFEIALSPENGRMELKSSANESWYVHNHPAPRFTTIRTTFQQQWPFHVTRRELERKCQVVLFA